MFLLLTLACSADRTAQAEPISAAAVDNATLQDTQGGEPNAGLVKAQILLDRLRFSPGVIDGKDGETTRLAVRTFQEAHRLGLIHK